MSRTVRRKNVSHHRSWVLREWKWVAAFGCRQQRMIDAGSDEGRKKLAVYHSDAGFGDYGHKSPPHWYRRYMNKRYDRKEEQRVIHDDDPVLPKRKRNASWYW